MGSGARYLVRHPWRVHRLHPRRRKPPRVHLQKVSEGKAGWGYSGLIVASFVVTLACGLWKIGSTPADNTEYYGETFARSRSSPSRSSRSRVPPRRRALPNCPSAPPAVLRHRRRTPVPGLADADPGERSGRPAARTRMAVPSRRSSARRSPSPTWPARSPTTPTTERSASAATCPRLRSRALAALLGTPPCKTGGRSTRRSHP